MEELTESDEAPQCTFAAWFGDIQYFLDVLWIGFDSIFVHDESQIFRLLYRPQTLIQSEFDAVFIEQLEDLSQVLFVFLCRIGQNGDVIQIDHDIREVTEYGVHYLLKEHWGIGWPEGEDIELIHLSFKDEGGPVTVTALQRNVPVSPFHVQATHVGFAFEFIEEIIDQRYREFEFFCDHIQFSEVKHDPHVSRLFRNSKE